MCVWEVLETHYLKSKPQKMHITGSQPAHPGRYFSEGRPEPVEAGKPSHLPTGLQAYRPSCTALVWSEGDSPVRKNETARRASSQGPIILIWVSFAQLGTSHVNHTSVTTNCSGFQYITFVPTATCGYKQSANINMYGNIDPKIFQYSRDDKILDYVG